MRKRRVLISDAGGDGSNALVGSFRQSRLDMSRYQLVGANIEAEILAKAPLEERYLLPVATDGLLVVGKFCEHLQYFLGAGRLSGMSSTPAVARTLRDDEALETIFRAVSAVCDTPHGNFNFDLMGVNLCELGPDPVVRHQAAGLKVAQVLTKGPGATRKMVQYCQPVVSNDAVSALSAHVRT